MAKDGTRRGGAQYGAGRKRKDLADRILEGETSVQNLTIPKPVDLQPADIPKPDEYLSAPQRSGAALGADDIFKETWLWIRERGCENLVSRQQVQSYAMSMARWVQCENAISEHGFIGKHPTTGKATASPFVSMGGKYLQQATNVWYIIMQVVRENCSVAYSGTVHDDNMENLLRMREK